MARNNISDYLNQITRLHKSSIKKENDYVMSNILNSDCVEFRMNGTKPVGKSIDGTIQGLEIDQTFDNIKDINLIEYFYLFYTFNQVLIIFYVYYN